MRKFLGIPILCLLGVIPLCAQQELRAIFNQATYSESKPVLSNSPQALRLYAELGYNTFFEHVFPPPKSEWDTLFGYRVKPPARKKLVSYIADQKRRLDSLGLAFAPFYNEWGWGITLPQLSDRTREMVYRDVNYLESYYGKTLFPGLEKRGTVSGGGVYWNPQIDTLKMVLSEGMNDKIGRLWLKISSGKEDLGEHLKSKLITGQCYQIDFTLDLREANLSAGDALNGYIWRAFEKGREPVADSVPFGQILHPSNLYTMVWTHNYPVISKFPNGRYRLRGIETVDSIIQMTWKVWIDSGTVCGRGTHKYTDEFRMDFQILTSQHKNTGRVILTNFNIRAVDPKEEIWGITWESRPDFDSLLCLYPSENERKSMGVYQSTSGKRFEKPLFGPARKHAGRLVGIKGHFPPLTTNSGAQKTQIAIDPLSPVTDMITTEMLQIIKEGLGGKEPPYFYINADEVNVYRRSIHSRSDFKKNSKFNQVSNGVYYANIIDHHIARYKKVFLGDVKKKASTTFIIAGDMLLPFGYGYLYYSPTHHDQSGLSALKKLSDGNRLAVAIWVYDYSPIPKYWVKSQIALENLKYMQDNIGRVQSNGLQYIAFYATDGDEASIQSLSPSINSDSAHLHHEFEMAKNWSVLVRKNPAKFRGYMVAGWWHHLKSNQWNGIFSMAYYGWADTVQYPFNPSWLKVKTKPVIKGKPVLKLLENESVPW